MHNRILLVLSWLIFSTCIGCAHSSRPVTGIIGGLDHEVAPLIEGLEHARTHTVRGIGFTSGELEGHRVVITTGGFGKVNTAITTTQLLDRFKPIRVLSIGTAGGLNLDLEVGDVVVAERVAHHDLGEYKPEGFVPSPSRNPFGGGEKTLFFTCDSQLVALSREVVEQTATPRDGGEVRPAIRARTGVIVSGDSFIASSDKRRELRHLFGADAVDMESAVVA